MLTDCFLYQIICIFILGLIMGSFYNVIIFRTLSGESIINPPSKCPKCDTRLLWWQKIPVFSYLYLKGKCYFCKNDIDIMYPTVEFLSGMLFVFDFIKFGFSLKFLFSIVVLSTFLILAGMDIQSNKISVKYTILALIAAVLFNYNNLADSVLGAIIGFGIFYVLKKISLNIFEKEVFGDGDIYLLSALGAFVGISHLVITLVIALMFQFIFCLPAFVKNILESKQYKIFYYSAWFIISYILFFMARIYVFNTNIFAKIFIFLNIIVSMFLVCKYLFSKIKKSEIALVEPFSPAIFLSLFLFLFLF